MSETCINCGDEIEGDGVYNANSVKEGAGEKLEGGESVPISEVIAFDDGPYCSLDCSASQSEENDD